MDKKHAIEQHFKAIMLALGLNITDPSLRDTPKRVAKMYVDELCYAVNNEPPSITLFPNKGYDQMVVVRDITFSSLCEHHFVPFTGVCHVAYIPGNKVIGLSKINRIVNYFSAKPQLQERLTQEICTYLVEQLECENIGVVMEASHLCCKIRGVKDFNSTTFTSYLGGLFRGKEVREEFMSAIKMGETR